MKKDERERPETQWLQVVCKVTEGNNLNYRTGIINIYR